MPKSKEEMRVFITARVISRLAGQGPRRSEALRDVFAVTLPDLDADSISRLVADTPEIPLELSTRWVGMFADRLLETVPENELEDLCANTQDSNATLLLLYSMFMESQRMEETMRGDIAKFNSQARGSAPDTAFAASGDASSDASGDSSGKASSTIAGRASAITSGTVH
ncbi:hypothetical protein LJC46_01340 [Desulfovibrio sp. OttesenSCG-928-G15]|nr:hypothetical protein [Desulfovibrio sp. OttesenSCG-928-G15]